MTISGLVFDLDGTLLDTLQSIGEAFNGALVSMGMPQQPIDAYRTIVGNGVKVAAERCLPTSEFNEHNTQTLMAEFQKRYDQTWMNTSPYEGIIAMIEVLRGTLPMAVLSNKNHEFTSQCIEHFFPNTFHPVIGFSDEVVHKPDPAGALKIAQSLQLPITELCMVGDTATDINTAKNAGMASIGVLWGFRQQEELKTAGADYIVNTPAEITAILKGADGIT